MLAPKNIRCIIILYGVYAAFVRVWWCVNISVPSNRRCLIVIVVVLVVAVVVAFTHLFNHVQLAFSIRFSHTNIHNWEQINKLANKVPFFSLTLTSLLLLRPNQNHCLIWFYTRKRQSQKYTKEIWLASFSINKIVKMVRDINRCRVFTIHMHFTNVYQFVRSSVNQFLEQL